ncbi:MAG: RNA polymerase sigma factor [Kofleriaceae bacterium]
MQATAELASASTDARLHDDRRFVYAVVRRMVRNEDDAHDVTQEAMLLAFRYRDSFRGDSHYRTWLYRIATTAALTYLRRERSRTARLTDEVVPEVSTGAAAGPDDALARARAARDLAGHIATLAPTYQEILGLRFFDDCSEREAARSLGISVSAVKLRTHRAKRALRERVTAAAS